MKSTFIVAINRQACSKIHHKTLYSTTAFMLFVHTCGNTDHHHLFPTRDLVKFDHKLMNFMAMIF